MPRVVELPHVGESVTEGIIGRWLKQPGDRVEKYDPLVEVMTDKVNMEVPAPFSGTLMRTLVSKGDTVPMGAPIAEMEVEGEEARAAPVPEGRFEFMEHVRSVGPTGSGEGGQGLITAPAPPRSALAARTPLAEGPGGGGVPVRLSPVVRRLAWEHRVDVTQIKGTGMGGRITKEDVLCYVESSARGEPVEPRAAPSPAYPEMVEGRPDEEEVPLTPLRQTIAERIAHSAREIPAAWAVVEADVTGLVACRDAHREAFQRQHGISLTYLAFVVQAVAEALREHPRLNTRWGGDRIYIRRRVNVGIAVATPEGLVVPVVHDADHLAVAELAVRVHELAERAKQQALRLEEVQGGSFTVNNTGALGTVLSYPIINHPQVAILTMEAVVKRPVVVEGDNIVVRSLMNVGLAFDHRVCDGAEAGAFLGAVKARLEATTARTPVV